MMLMSLSVNYIGLRPKLFQVPALFFYERNFRRVQSVLRIQVGVRPCPAEVLHGHEGVLLPGRVVRYLPKPEEEPEEFRPHVRCHVLAFLPGAAGAYDHVGFAAYASGRRHYGLEIVGADDAGTHRRGHEHLPLSDVLEPPGRDRFGHVSRILLRVYPERTAG